MKPIYTLSNPIEMRWVNPENPTGARGAGGQAHRGRKGAPALTDIQPGQSWTLAEGEGCGTIRRIWVTLDNRSAQALRGVVIRFYWDGANTPAIEAPLGDFFACPLGRMTSFASEWFDTAEGRNFNCRLPMPFRKSFKITITNESPLSLAWFWYHLDYTLGDAHDENTGYLHAHYRRENPTTLRRDFEILPFVQGRGRYLGTAFGVICDTERYGSNWWGEGEVKIYLDGDAELPTLCGTGAEDYICTSWGQGEYSLPWYGCPLADSENMQYAMYRFHGFDPIFFEKEIRVTIQQIGWASDEQQAVLVEKNGADIRVVQSPGWPILNGRENLFERQDDWSAIAYFYLDSPENELPPIEEYSARVAGLLVDSRPAARLDI